MLADIIIISTLISLQAASMLCWKAGLVDDFLPKGDYVMTTYGQDITLADGSVCGSMGCATPQEALSQAVSLARADGWHPPRWWEIWLPACYDEVRAEYHKQEKAT